MLLSERSSVISMKIFAGSIRRFATLGVAPVLMGVMMRAGAATRFAFAVAEVSTSGAIFSSTGVMRFEHLIFVIRRIHCRHSCSK